MKKTLLISALATSLVLGSAVTASAEGWYIGGGLANVRFSNDLVALDGTDGTGLELSFGYRFNEMFSLDSAIASMSVTDNDGDKLVYGNFLFGPKMTFMPITKTGWTPWASFDFSYHSLDYNSFSLTWDGWGWTFALGADFRVSEWGVIELALRQHQVELTSSPFGVKSDTTMREIFFGYQLHLGL